MIRYRVLSNSCEDYTHKIEFISCLTFIAKHVFGMYYHSTIIYNPSLRAE